MSPKDHLSGDALGREDRPAPAWMSDAGEEMLLRAERWGDPREDLGWWIELGKL